MRAPVSFQVNSGGHYYNPFLSFFYHYFCYCCSAVLDLKTHSEGPSHWERLHCTGNSWLSQGWLMKNGFSFPESLEIASKCSHKWIVHHLLLKCQVTSHTLSQSQWLLCFLFLVVFFFSFASSKIVECKIHLRGDSACFDYDVMSLSSQRLLLWFSCFIFLYLQVFGQNSFHCVEFFLWQSVVDSTSMDGESGKQMYSWKLSMQLWIL